MCAVRAVLLFLMSISVFRDTKYLERYQEAVRGVQASLLERSHPGRLAFIGELDFGVFKPKVIDRFDVSIALLSSIKPFYGRNPLTSAP